MAVPVYNPTDVSEGSPFRTSLPSWVTSHFLDLSYSDCGKIKNLKVVLICISPVVKDVGFFSFLLCIVFLCVCTCMWNTDQCWVSSFFTFLRQGRLLDLEITDWLDWLANELPESFCLLFPCLGTRAYMAAGEQTQVLVYLLCLLPCLPSTLLMPQRLSPQETSLARIRLDPSRTTHNSTLVLHLPSGLYSLQVHKHLQGRGCACLRPLPWYSQHHAQGLALSSGIIIALSLVMCGGLKENDPRRLIFLDT